MGLGEKEARRPQRLYPGMSPWSGEGGRSCAWPRLSQLPGLSLLLSHAVFLCRVWEYWAVLSLPLALGRLLGRGLMAASS